MSEQEPMGLPGQDDASNVSDLSFVPDLHARGLELRQDERGLTLVGEGMELRGDLAHMLPRLRPTNLHREMLVRAAHLKGFEGTPKAVDATAGLGEDALLLAAAGFEVALYERDAVIAALLRDSLRRAARVPELADAVGRMTLHEGDSIEALKAMATPEALGAQEAPDVVLLDPMFPTRHKSASVKKKLQMLQQLEQPCDDEEELLRAACHAAKRKVVVKRPVKGPYLAGVKPNYSLAGKAVRYDVIVCSPGR